MSERLTITPLGPYIGAQVSGLDVTRPLSDNQFEQLYHAVLRHQVVFLREQAITPQQQRALALRFGDLHIHPVYPHAEGWRRLSFWIPTTITRRITTTGTPM
jgi:taurine dioxygenase